MITGCDSGFGFILAQDLKENGCDVIGKNIKSEMGDKRPPPKMSIFRPRIFRPLVLIAQNEDQIILAFYHFALMNN